MKNRFSIKDLEQFSGIKAHTLRIWEKRYDMLNPNRTKTNIRWYSSDDLKRLLNIALLYHHDHKISKIAALTDKELADKVAEIAQNTSDYSIFVDGLVMAMIEMDEQRFEKIFSSGLIKLGFEDTIAKVVYPFLIKIGFMWQMGSSNPAQEHFVSNLIRQKIIAAIDGQVVPMDRSPKKAILFLPDGEMHELGLLVLNYMMRARGLNTYYLGQSVPMEDLRRACEIKKPDYLVSVFTSPMPKLKEFVRLLSQHFPHTKIILSGKQILSANLKLPSQFYLLPSFDQLNKHLS